MSERHISSHGKVTPTNQKDHRFVISYDVGNKPIIGIYTSTPMGGGTVNIVGTPIGSSTSPLVSIIVVCGANETEGGLHHFELQLSSYQSSINSPTSSCSEITIGSCRSHSESITPRKLSIVAASGNDFLPLKSVVPTQS